MMKIRVVEREGEGVATAERGAQIEEVADHRVQVDRAGCHEYGGRPLRTFVNDRTEPSSTDGRRCGPVRRCSHRGNGPRRAVPAVVAYRRWRRISLGRCSSAAFASGFRKASVRVSSNPTATDRRFANCGHRVVDADDALTLVLSPRIRSDPDRTKPVLAPRAAFTQQEHSTRRTREGAWISGTESFNSPRSWALGAKDIRSTVIAAPGPHPTSSRRFEPSRRSWSANTVRRASSILRRVVVHNGHSPRRICRTSRSRALSCHR
jgi:hypothetical protein